ncbi:MAG: ABC transporter ATP-binding protein [Clostridia bacterium]|nr:ABC transporter ATP-binding protein [Clostridia bacterium]
MIQLQLEAIEKKYQNTNIKNFNLSVKYGEIYGLVCDDYDTKKLLGKIITGLAKPTKGRVIYFSRKRKHGATHHLRRVGIATDDVYFYEEMSGYENIRLYIDAYKKRLNKLDTLSMNARIEQYFKLFNLMTSKNVPVKKYSQGMRQKLKLIRAFVIEPRILILDDPFVALDPVTIKQLIQHLKFLSRKKGVSILLLTTMATFLDTFVDRIGLVRNETLIDEMTHEELKFHQQSYLAVQSEQLPYLLTVIERKLNIYDYEVVNDTTVHIVENLGRLKTLHKILMDEGVHVQEMKYGFDSLEHFYLEKIGE